jgi:hypothetical protein
MLEQCQRQQTRRQKRSNQITSFDRNIQNPTYHQPLWKIYHIVDMSIMPNVHFLLKCDTLSTIRNNHLVRLALYLEKIQVNTDYLVNSEKDLLHLIIDCSASNLIDSIQERCWHDLQRYDLCSAFEKSRTTLRVKIAVSHVFI